MLKDKLLKKFSNEELRLKFSAINDEEKMRDCIEKCLKLYPIKGKKIAVETGTYHGLSTALLADYFDEVHTFDIPKEKGGYYISSEIKYQIWNYLGIQEKIRFHLIKDDKEKEEILKTIKYDFAFIDGNHAVGCKIDFKLLNSCGRILFHDYEPDKRYGFYLVIYNFINSLDNIVYKNPPFALWIKKK